MATAISFAQFIRFPKTSAFLHGNGLRSFKNSLSFSSASSSALSSPQLLKKKWRQPVVSVLELGGAKIVKDGNFFHFLIWVRFYFSVDLAFLNVKHSLNFYFWVWSFFHFVDRTVFAFWESQYLFVLLDFELLLILSFDWYIVCILFCVFSCIKENFKNLVLGVFIQLLIIFLRWALYVTLSHTIPLELEMQK